MPFVTLTVWSVWARLPIGRVCCVSVAGLACTTMAAATNQSWEHARSPSESVRKRAAEHERARLAQK